MKIYVILYKIKQNESKWQKNIKKKKRKENKEIIEKKDRRDSERHLNNKKLQ